MILLIFTILFLVNIFPLSSTIKILLNVFVYCITSLSIYLYLFYKNQWQHFFSFRLFFSYFLADSAIAAVFFLLVSIVQMMPISIILQFLCIYFIGLYFLCRLSLIPALIAARKPVFVQHILFKNKNSYFQWMLAATILYLPFFWIRMFLVEGIALSFISSLQSPLLCCFYVCYLKKR